MTIAEKMRVKLNAAFAPEELVIEDESAKHAGHGGSRPGGETHFRVRIVSERFAGQPRIARHREVYAVLKDELEARVHALALVTLTREETARKA